MDWNSDDLLLGAEIDEFRSEKTVKANKSLDEIEKLCVDETLGDLEKVSLLLGSTFDVQKIWAVDHIVPLMRKQGNSSLLLKLLPKVTSLLKPSTSSDVHRAVSRCFTDVATDSALQTTSFANHFLPTILSQFESSNAIVSKIWLESLLASVSVISKDMIKHKILNLMRSKCQLSQTIQARQSSCAIIGRIAGEMESYWVKQDLLPLVRTLSQDVDQEVRTSMCKELPKIAKALGSDFANSHLLDELEELSKDDEVAVRCTALSVLADMIPIVDDVCRKEQLIPLLIMSLEEAVGSKRRDTVQGRSSGEEADQMRIQAARLIGRLCYELKDFYSNENVEVLLDVYDKLSKTETVSTPIKNHSGTPLKTQAQSTPCDKIPSIVVSCVPADDDGTECRRLCAYNIPGMMLFAVSFKKNGAVISVLKTLACDSHWKVRQAVALGFHEVIKLLGKKSTTLSSDYGKLLKDPRPEVLSGLMDGIPDVLEVFAEAFKLEAKTKQPGLLELVQPLLSAERVASRCRQWRVHCELLEQFSNLTHCMTSEQLYASFVPLLWRYIGNTKRPESGKGRSTAYVLPVKKAACRTMCHYISSIRKAELRKEICTKFITECAQSSYYKQRLLFIDVCQIILEMFSRKFFKENGFYSAVASFAKDSTVNVRYRLCTFLPELKSVLLLPLDREYQKQLETAIAALLMDRDPECLVVIRQSVKLMDKISYRMQSMVTYSLEDEVIDKEKEDAERLLLKEEEEWEREKDRESSNHRLYPDRKSAPVTRNSATTSPGVQRKRPNQLHAAGTANKKGLSPEMARKTSNQGLSPIPNSPGVVSKSGKSQKSRTSAGSTPNSTKRSLSEQSSSPDPPGRSARVSSSPDILLTAAGNSFSPKGGVKANKPRDGTVGGSTLKSSPGQANRRAQYGLVYSTKASSKKT